MKDLHMALAPNDEETHLTDDAEKTLCGAEVVDLPERATNYCVYCIDIEYAISKRPLEPLVGILSAFP